ncbi:TetR/AcrR family transcriptional regulator [Ornithinimicrobium faecis]|uniref:TetR/AcrR family transcriptional regulator n=1 Tax=Ornithinimicrobium faecis TaxID=2934158 RepID=A0ABY4YUB8_9MICO|nr:TetR/AcrR family transcriptional regulator [Ornithinimicrobium sp. HY1793]
MAQIEAAAGLSPGSGSLYKHFRSKEELLTAGMNRLLAGGDELADQLTTRAPQSPAEQLAAVVTAGLRRLDEDRDVSRLLFRGLESFPELLQRFGTEEIGRFHAEAVAMLADLADDPAGTTGTTDWEAVAVVLQGAVVHYWLMTDLFGAHPSGVGEDRFVKAAADLLSGFLGSEGRS